MRALDADLGGLVVEARGRVDGLGPDAVIEASVSAHTDLGAAFQATGIRLPVSMDVAPTDRLGTASGELAIRGPLWRPAELLLTPELRFESTPGGIEKLQFLNRPFRYEPPGSGASIEVRAGAPGLHLHRRRARRCSWTRSCSPRTRASTATPAWTWRRSAPRGRTTWSAARSPAAGPRSRSSW